MINKEDLEELQERFDTRYKLKDECDKEMTAVSDKLSNDATQFAVINTKLSLILWGLGAISVAVIGFLVRYVFGG